MKRTTAEGATIDNRYTEGNPALGIPATVVGGEEMNNIQEELCNIVEDAGLTLNGSDEDQVLEALKIIIQRGGTQITGDIDNNQAAAVDLTGVSFDKTEVKSARFKMDVFRRDDGQSATELFDVTVIYDPESDAWLAPIYDKSGQDTEVILSITAAGQIQSKSSNYAGANYDGDFRVTDIITVAI